MRIKQGIGREKKNVKSSKIGVSAGKEGMFGCKFDMNQPNN
jgi:hypothetical protein